MSAAITMPRETALGARRAIVAAARGLNPGEDLLFTWPAGAALSPVEREECRRRVHSAGYALFGTGQYHCLTVERGIVLRRPAGKTGA